MNYALQKDLLKRHHEDMLFDVLDRYKLPIYNFKYIPFDQELEFENEIPDKHTILFGSVNACTKSAKKYNWTPGSFYNINHDYSVYSKEWKENLLNYDSIVQKLSDPVKEDFFFARPTGDTKTILGKLYGRITYEEKVSCAIINGANPNETVQICTPKTILQEARCFVVKGKVVTASYYKWGASTMLLECKDEDIISFAQEMVDHFQVSDAFVIDVCRTDNGLKIVEVNCFNCSGFYHIDMYKLIDAIETNF